MYDKRGNFSFRIVNFPFISSTCIHVYLLHLAAYSLLQSTQKVHSLSFRNKHIAIQQLVHKCVASRLIDRFRTSKITTINLLTNTMVFPSSQVPTFVCHNSSWLAGVSCSSRGIPPNSPLIYIFFKFCTIFTCFLELVLYSRLSFKFQYNRLVLLLSPSNCCHIIYIFIILWSLLLVTCVKGQHL